MRYQYGSVTVSVSALTSSRTGYQSKIRARQVPLSLMALAVAKTPAACILRQRLFAAVSDVSSDLGVSYTGTLTLDAIAFQHLDIAFSSSARNMTEPLKTTI